MICVLGLLGVFGCGVSLLISLVILSVCDRGSGVGFVDFGFGVGLLIVLEWLMC